MSEKENKNIDTDYDTSRSTYLDLMDKGQSAMDMMMEVARESEHPRAYEVLSGMMKNIADITDKLMDLNKKEKDIKQSTLPVPTQPVPGQTVNNLFVGTTEELQRMLQDNDEKVIDVTPNDET
jgi:hypothetical protein